MQLAKKTLVLIFSLFLLPVMAAADTQVRGVNAHYSITATDIDAIAALGANIVRIQLSWAGDVNNAPEAEYLAWFNSAIAHVDTLLPLFQTHGIKVLLDMHSPPGGFAKLSPIPQLRVFTEQWPRDTLNAIWLDLATKYAGNTTIYAFEVLSEPAVGSRGSSAIWHSLAASLTQTVLAADPARKVMIAPEFANPNRLPKLVKNLRKALGNTVHDASVLYTVHLFSPSQYVKQGIGNNRTIKYPSKKAKKGVLRKMLKKVKKRMKKAKLKHLNIGEFSVVRWAPGAARYLKDIIGFFEKFGWDYEFHIFREATEWSIEHSSDKNDPAKVVGETDRATVLKQFFARNP